jgi:hypothetical protein
MANEALLNLGSELVLKVTGTTEVLADGDIYECVDDTRTSADDAGMPLGIFELDLPSAAPFSGTPGDGAAFHLYERKIDSNGNSAPVVDSSYKHDYMWTFTADNSNGEAQRFTSPPIPINRSGGKYVIEWVPVTGAVTVDGDWILRLWPVTYGT